MSERTAAIAILPFLILLTLTLECVRIGTLWAVRSLRRRASRRQATLPDNASEAADLISPNPR